MTFFGYRVLSRLAEVLPLRAVPVLSTVAGHVGAALLSKRRTVVHHNLRRVLEPATDQATQATLRQVTRRCFASYVRYWLDALRLPTVELTTLERHFSIEGFEHLRAAQAKGKGVILAVPHVGNWDVAGAWLAGQGIAITVVVEKLEPPELFTWFADFRRSLGLTIVVNGPDVGRQLLAALRRNEVIALLCDRDLDGTGAEVRFFGEITRLPKGPATLALRSGAALLPAAAYQVAGARHHTVIEAPVTCEREGRLGDDVVRITQEMAHRLESLIHQAPEQWHLFQPNWPDQPNHRPNDRPGTRPGNRSRK